MYIIIMNVHVYARKNVAAARLRGDDAQIYTRHCRAVILRIFVVKSVRYYNPLF